MPEPKAPTPPPSSGTPAAPPSSSSAPTDPSSTTTTPPAAPEVKYHGTPAAIHNGAIVVTALGVLGLLLPPRKMDMRTTLLSGATYLGSSQLVYDYTGQSLHQRVNGRMSGWTESMSSIPEPARRAQAAIRAERERIAQEQLAAAASDEERRRIQEEVAAREEARRKSDWRRQWDEAEKKAFSEGKGYGDLIMDTIREVVGYGSSKGGGDGDASAGDSVKPDGAGKSQDTSSQTKGEDDKKS